MSGGGSGGGHHPNGFISFLYYFYIPMMVIYLPFALWEKLRHYLGWLVTGWWPLILAGLSLLILIFARYVVGKKSLPLLAWVMLWVFVLAGSGIWGWNWWSDRSIPSLEWKRLGMEVLEAESDANPRYMQLQIIVDGTLQPAQLLTADDVGKLDASRQKHLGKDGMILIKYAVFESNEIPKFPASVRVSRADLNLWIGVYLVRDDQAPTVRLSDIGTDVPIQGHAATDSRYRLVILFFPLDNTSASLILKPNFNPNDILQFNWKRTPQTQSKKGH